MTGETVIKNQALKFVVFIALMGILYDRSIPGLVIFSVVVQLASIPLLVWVVNRSRHA